MPLGDLLLSTKDVMDFRLRNMRTTVTGNIPVSSKETGQGLGKKESVEGPHETFAFRFRCSRRRRLKLPAYYRQPTASKMISFSYGQR